MHLPPEGLDCPNTISANNSRPKWPLAYRQTAINNKPCSKTMRLALAGRRRERSSYSPCSWKCLVFRQRTRAKTLFSLQNIDYSYVNRCHRSHEPRKKAFIHVFGWAGKPGRYGGGVWAPVRGGGEQRSANQGETSPTKNPASFYRDRIILFALWIPTRASLGRRWRTKITLYHVHVQVTSCLKAKAARHERPHVVLEKPKPACKNCTFAFKGKIRKNHTGWIE